MNSAGITNAIGNSVQTGEPIALFDPLLTKVVRRRAKNVVQSIRRRVKEKKAKSKHKD